jgi:hypothetical protein
VGGFKMTNKEMVINYIHQEWNQDMKVKIVISEKEIEIYESFYHEWKCTATFDIEDKDGYIAKSMVDCTKYKSLKRWQNGIEKRLSTKLDWESITA